MTTDTQTQHTPGPWAVACESGNDHEAYVIEGNERTIAWTTNTYDADTDAETITDEDRANARLIASAPKLAADNAALLAALTDAVRMLKAWDKEYGSQVTDIRRMEAVITEAS